MIFRKILCWIFGHRRICLYRFNNLRYMEDGYGPHSEMTGWKCQRCHEEIHEQRDI